MKSIKKLAQNLWNDESAQGATEYILLLVVVVGIVMAFKKPIMEAINKQLAGVTSDMSSISNSQ